MAQPIHTRAALAAMQLAQLRDLLEAIRRDNPFYRRKLASIPAGSEAASLEEFSRVFPVTEKAELIADQRDHPPYGTNLTYPLARYSRCHQTSGSSGQPLRWLDTPESWQWMLGNWREVYRAAGVAESDRVLFAFSFGPFLGFWTAFEAAAQMKCFCYPAGGLSSTARVRAVMDHRITVVCCTPTYALRLAEVAREEEVDLAGGKVRLLIVAGEPGGSIPATRRQLERAWPGARVFDHHGSTEVGPVSFECPATPGRLHVIETAYIPEVVDPQTGQAVAEGQTGELLLTNLGRTGSPLLRYRTGDLVRPVAWPPHTTGAPCGCGRYDLGLEGGILGRTDDMIVVRGVNVYPGAIEEIVRAVGGIAEYQVRVVTESSLPELSLIIEPVANQSDPEALGRQLERRFQNALSLRVPVQIVSAGTLPRFELKARRWIKEQ